MKRYKTTAHQRIAKRNCGGVIFHSQSGNGIEVDDKSFEIYLYIKENEPVEEDLFHEFEEVTEKDMVDFITFLVENKFVEEINNINTAKLLGKR